MERRYRAALRTLERNARELKKERRQAAAATGTDIRIPNAPPAQRSAAAHLARPVTWSN